MAPNCHFTDYLTLDTVMCLYTLTSKCTILFTLLSHRGSSLDPAKHHAYFTFSHREPVVKKTPPGGTPPTPRIYVDKSQYNSNRQKQKCTPAPLYLACTLYSTPVPFVTARPFKPARYSNILPCETRVRST